jgi:hypothetical protein
MAIHTSKNIKVTLDVVYEREVTETNIIIYEGLEGQLIDERSIKKKALKILHNLCDDKPGAAYRDKLIRGTVWVITPRLEASYPLGNYFKLSKDSRFQWQPRVAAPVEWI